MKVDGVVVVFLDPRGHRQDVRIEDDVLGRKADLLGQQLVGPPADPHLVADLGRLALFVKRHHDHRRAVAADQPRPRRNSCLAVLQADRVDDRLALHALQAGFEHRPLRAVDHDRHAADVRLGRNQVQEPRHHRFAVQQGVVHVDVDDAGARLDLLPRDLDRLFELLFADQPSELARAGDVGPLADHDEIRVRTQRQRFLAAQPRLALDRRPRARRRHPAPARAICSIYRGVVPQQPPTMFSQPLSRELALTSLPSSGATGRSRQIRSAARRWDDN